MKKRSTQNLRFWATVNGDWVKFTLRPNEVLVHGTWTHDEEGGEPRIL